MIIIFGQGLIFWTGILAGIFFILSFLGCSCRFNLSFLRNTPLQQLFNRHHRKFVYAAFFIFLLHAGLGLLSKGGVYI